MNSERSHLILAAHHDDAEFGCGGIMARFAATERFAVRIAASTDYRRASAHGDITIKARTRDDETAAALASLGVRDWRTWDFCENGGNVWDLSALADRITVSLSAYTDLYIPQPGFNQDHRAVHAAAMIALRLVGIRPYLRRVWFYEYPGDCADTPVAGRRTTILNDMQLRAKIAALRLHRSQWDGRNAGFISPDGALKLAAFRGAAYNAPGAEVHCLVQELHP